MAKRCDGHLTTRQARHASEARMIRQLKLILVTLLAGAFMIWAPTAGHAHAGHKHNAAQQVTSAANGHAASARDQLPFLPAQIALASSASAKPALDIQIPCGSSCCSNQSCCSAVIAAYPDGFVLPALYRAAPPTLSPSPSTPAAIDGPSEPPRSFA